MIKKAKKSSTTKKSTPKKKTTKKKTSAKKRTPKKKIAKTLTIRQVKYKQFRLEGHTKYSAARLAGYSHMTAIHAKQSIESGIPTLDQELEIAGLTIRALAKHAAEGIKATKIDPNAMQAVPDWQIRHRYYESILRDRNLAKTDKGPLVDQSEHTHLTIVVQKEDEEDAGGEDSINETPELRVELTN